MKKALVIVEIVKDFCEGGKLQVIGGNATVPLINNLIEKYLKDGNIVVASRELHPYNHSAFAFTHGKPEFSKDENGDTLWPAHCVDGTEGAEFHSDLKMDGVIICTKGRDLTYHPYSAFDAIVDGKDLWLYDFLNQNDVSVVDVVGLALDWCVKETAIDAIELGFRTRIIHECTAAIGDAEETYNLLASKHIENVAYEDIIKE